MKGGAFALCILLNCHTLFSQCDEQFIRGLNKSAFVVGMDTYDDQSEILKGGVKDALSVAQALRDLGFNPKIDTNVNMGTLINDLILWTEHLRKQRVKVAIFYFAGHGAQIDGDNYLYLKDAIFDNDKNVVINHTYSVRKLISDMQTANDGINVLILDACRNNPTRNSKKTFTRKGLTTMSLTKPGILIGYPVPEGQTTLDGDGTRNSLYTASLINHLKTPGIGIKKIFGRVEDEVYKLSGDKKQLPFVNTSIGDENDICISYQSQKDGSDFFDSPTAKQDVEAFRRLLAATTPEISDDTLDVILYSIKKVIDTAHRRLRDSLGKQIMYGDGEDPDYINSSSKLFSRFGYLKYGRKIINSAFKVKVTPTDILILLEDGEDQRIVNFVKEHHIEPQAPIKLSRDSPDWKRLYNGVFEYYLKRRDILLGID